jgi:pantothenate kinase type III
MLSGAQIGIVCEVEGFIERFEKQLGNIKIIITGGDGEYIFKNILIKNAHYEPNLVLIGLNQILNFNK